MRTISCCLALSITLIGCTREPAATPRTPQPDATDATGDARHDKGETADDGRADVQVDPKLKELCDLPTPRFAFDSANLSPSTAQALDALVSCFTDGPAKDRRLLVVGHADPRGEEIYNLALGQRRAGSVAGHLERRGMPVQRLETSSRGEIDAEGQDETGWAKDRRVELGLADDH